MSRKSPAYVVGDYWLDKRRDGKAPDIWQIASYKAASRSISYRSTHCRVLEDAKPVIHAFSEAQRAKRPQDASARVLPLLTLFWQEHGSKAVSPSQIASSIRAFIGFFMQDEVTADVTIADLKPMVFDRFREWRMSEHSYDVPWGDKSIRHRTKGVNGETVQRNFDDFRAAMGHHARNGRIPYAPKVPAVRKGLRSPPRDRRLSLVEIGAIIGFFWEDDIMRRWVLTMLATAARPIAAMKFDPAKQWKKAKTLDLHPPGDPLTKKHNPVLPVIPEFVPELEAWTKAGTPRVRSRRTAWHTMRRCLGFGLDVVPKTIRHTVATRLRALRVPPHEISEVLGHAAFNRTTSVYAKYDPDFLIAAKAALSIIWQESIAASVDWRAGHRRSKTGNGQTIVVVLSTEKD